MLKRILSYVVIFGAGCFAGYMVSKKMLEAKYAELAQAEIDSVKEVLGRTSAERLAKQIANVEVRDISKDDANRVIVKSRNNTDYTNSRIAYHEMAKENIRKRWDEELGAAAEFDEFDEDETAEEEPETDDAGYSEADHEDTYVERDLTGIDRTEPYIITDQEFAEEFPHHDKASLYYYLGDGTLCGEDEEIIPDIPSTVGFDVLDIMRTEKIAWVRNEPLGVDFEICAVQSGYGEAMIGVRHGEDISKTKPLTAEPKILTPRERYERKNNKQWSEDDEG